MAKVFDFLEPLVDIENRIQELERLSGTNGLDLRQEVQALRDKLTIQTRATFDGLTAWQRVQLARHPERPQTSDYIDHMVEDFLPLAGDRAFADDEAIVSGMGVLGPHKLMIIGQQKGKDVHERRRCNFGSPHPEGYRKAMAKMRLAERFGLPILCLVNTPGAFPGIGAEERGQSIAIAENIKAMSRLRVPVVVVVIGEGGSGGALAIGVGDRVLILENSYYSVISPEGCAAILWKDGGKADVAADRLRLTAKPLLELKVVDGIVEEPPGGAHRDHPAMAAALKRALVAAFDELGRMPVDALLSARYARYRALGRIAG